MSECILRISILLFSFFFFTKVDIDSVKLYNSALFYRVFVSFHFVTFKNFENSNRKFELSSFLKWRNDQSLIRVCRVCDVFLLLVLVLVTLTRWWGCNLGAEIGWWCDDARNGIIRRLELL